jgi:hypothetical protein
LRWKVAKLKREKGDISQGNPAQTTRHEHGPLFLTLSGHRFEVAEEMSVWDAIGCAPSPLKPLGEGEFLAFSQRVIQAVETANRPYGILVSLGLRPDSDWEGLSINTAKRALTFLNALGAHKHSVKAWEAAWVEHTVPGFDSAREFYNSELGAVLRRVPPDDDGEGEEPKLLERIEYRQMVERARAEGVIDQAQATLLELFYDIQNFSRMLAVESVRRVLGGTVTERVLKEYLGEAVRRVREHADRHSGSGRRNSSR